MKKILFTILAISLCSLPLFAEKVYRSDGSFFELKRNEGVYALKLDRVSHIYTFSSSAFKVFFAVSFSLCIWKNIFKTQV